MTIDAVEAKRLQLPVITVPVERGRLQFFAKAIGETDPVYTDLAAAAEAGHPDLPVPPTFFFSLELSSPDPFAYLRELNVDMRQVLHGEQSFEYHTMVHAGETVTVRPRIADVFAKKGGALEFLVRRTDFVRGGELVAEATSTLVVQNAKATS
ncbi:MaoC family dehydratase N-terminal domain-containing protein [Amycolatopsis sp. GM8]|uniref:MaoC family dehydratase N-terminal domain-containing protein n=1 Tax=Amycolatopsis sp. GM8 TaxID=2896530 RepID=UPI001F443F9A|nr:MaoC family dehydratase N-terminal domain-containing protein [Amycolatopsis sp. GM8]